MDAESSWQALLAGRSGVGLVRNVDLTDLPSRIAGQIHDLDAPAVFGVRQARALDRFAQFAVLAARAAVLDAGFVATGGDRWLVFLLN